MTSITTIVERRVRTAGLEHQGQNSISNPDQNLGLTCIFSSGMQEIMLLLFVPNCCFLIGRGCIMLDQTNNDIRPQQLTLRSFLSSDHSSYVFK